MNQARLLDAVLQARNLKTDKELAEVWGLTSAHISQYRSGKHRFDDYALARIAEALHADFEALVAERELDKQPKGERQRFWERVLRSLLGPRWKTTRGGEYLPERRSAHRRAANE